MENYKIALITAHTGYTDKPELTITPECQKELDAYGVDVYRFNNANIDLLKPYFIPELKKEDLFHETLGLKLRYWYNKHIRYRQKTYPTAEENYNRLIAKLPKIEFYKLIPETYDYYIWCDSKFTLKSGWLQTIIDMITRFEDNEMIVFSHSERNSILEEFHYMKFYIMKNNSTNLLSKYNLADMSRQVYYYLKNKYFMDNKLYELGHIIYSNKILQKKDFLEEWYAHNYFFSIQDQLSFPYLCEKYNVSLGVLTSSIYKIENTEYTYN